MKKLSMHSGWDSLTELDTLQNRLRALFLGGVDADEWGPALDLSEEEKAYLIAVDLAGGGREDAKVRVEDGDLLVSCERRREEGAREEVATGPEVAYARYLRRFQLPEEVETKKITALFRDGVLLVRLPKGKAKKGRRESGKWDVPLR